MLPRTASVPAALPGFGAIEAEFARDGFRCVELAESSSMRSVIELESCYDAAPQIKRKLGGSDALVLCWYPGKTSYRWAQRHTPVICWTNSGFKMVESKSIAPTRGSGLVNAATSTGFFSGKSAKSGWFSPYGEGHLRADRGGDAGIDLV